MTVNQLIKLLEETKTSFTGTPYEVVIKVKGGRKGYNKIERICTDTGICGTYVTLQLSEDNLDERVHYSNRKNDL